MKEEKLNCTYKCKTVIINEVSTIAKSVSSVCQKMASTDPQIVIEHHGDNVEQEDHATTTTTTTKTTSTWTTMTDTTTSSQRPPGDHQYSPGCAGGIQRPIGTITTNLPRLVWCDLVRFHHVLASFLAYGFRRFSGQMFPPMSPPSLSGEIRVFSVRRSQNASTHFPDHGKIVPAGPGRVQHKRNIRPQRLRALSGRFQAFSNQCCHELAPGAQTIGRVPRARPHPWHRC